MASKQSKTPITLLQEICAKQNPKELPVYTELSETPFEYLDQNMRFFTKCNALGFSSVGGGVTKKIAKHTAAERLLYKLSRNADSDDDDEQTYQSLETNSITELLDYCANKNFHKPEFACISSYGLSHDPSFTFECRLDTIKRTATAGTKQTAKQLSAKAVLEVIRKSYPDLEKKLVAINGSASVPETTRQKATTYLELKKKNLVEKMGTSIKERHNFFRIQEEEFCDALRTILKSKEFNESQRYENLLKELQTMWPVKIEKFFDTDLLKFELLIDYEKFTCVIVGNEQDLKTQVLKYFDEMLCIVVPQPESNDEGYSDELILHSW